MQILHHFAFSSFHPFIPVRAPLRSRVLPADRATLQLPAGLCEGPGDRAGAPGAEQQPRFVKAMGLLCSKCEGPCVWTAVFLLFIHIFDLPGPENRPRICQFVYGHADTGK